MPSSSKQNDFSLNITDAPHILDSLHSDGVYDIDSECIRSKDRKTHDTMHIAVLMYVSGLFGKNSGKRL